MDIITLTINRKKVMTEKGSTVLDAARAAGIYVPAICNYPELKPLAQAEPDMAKVLKHLTH